MACDDFATLVTCHACDGKIRVTLLVLSSFPIMNCNFQASYRATLFILYDTLFLNLAFFLLFFPFDYCVEVISFLVIITFIVKYHMIFLVGLLLAQISLFHHSLEFLLKPTKT